ncbi:L-seryl-tRNA(Sec) selenium transferase [Campylobacter hyointestinalis subsp. hyointestinalis]|uniref:L-seryl-tRNA(Sec) selenium transferase n=1 Tax=Campylobacter hyointestinalis TaxID=198 RepID=UPI0010FFA2FC|nr:L-seryl-tRNA(Sec) selenium transferase [Campylobacter hyointestinalis]QCU00563.1 L-seryl-tRNA(Sec) selenium transferase [Campylobacter hyointestinalis subsp. hyointestinalis]
MAMKLPKIDKIVNLKQFENGFKPALLEIAKKVINKLREDKNSEIKENEIIDLIAKDYAKFENLCTKNLINATGVVVHTNLGRSPISKEIIEKITPLISSYSNLEYDIGGGKRGDRYSFTSYLFKLMLGCQDALIVNNNAAAVFLVLNTYAKDKEVIVSRGELVEIGGSFRIPEVMASSGCLLKEVGTTNKTRLSDYENAINENTNVILKVHKSNYDIVGFSGETSIEDISNLAKKSNLISYYDLGSAYVNELPFNLGKDEKSLKKVLQSGVDLVSFSGDKLFGSTQCGIILGKKELIDKLKQNQLLRMLRVDKITLSILNETIKAYLNKEYKLIKPLNQIYKNVNELEILAKNVAKNIKFKTQIKSTKTFIGGGSLPNTPYPSIALAFLGNANTLEQEFRQKGIIGRIEEGKFILDFRSIYEDEIPNLINKINEVNGE